MAFNSLGYVLFLPLAVLFYYCVAHRWRWFFLLVVSYLFYMCWRPPYAVLIFVITCVAYFCAIRIEESQSVPRRKALLILSIFVHLGVLFLFRYFDFFRDSASVFFRNVHMSVSLPVLDVILPIGISFFTLQSMGYTIDVYAGKKKAERHWGYLAAFIAFFPKLIAGPIERAGNVLPQLKEERYFDADKVTIGLQLILLGFVKKIVIADRLSVYVDYVYADPMSFSSLALLFATIFFSFQIYADFSGYTDIAIGSARLFGINLTPNFHSPYFARSIQRFWQRWHISLSNWFRDYVYIPMGGKQGHAIKWIFNILFVFGLAGLWHGAGWHFVVWGLLHGLLYLITFVFKGRLFQGLVYWVPDAVKRITCVILTFICVTLLWIFFRAASVSEALSILMSICTLSNLKGEVLLVSGSAFWQNWLVIALLVFMDFETVKRRARIFANQSHVIVRWGVYYLIIWAFFLFAVFFVNKPFIF